MNQTSVFNLTLEKTLRVGEITKKVRIESSNPEVTHEDMVVWANRALEDGVITGCQGVNIEVNVTPAHAAPIFTPAHEDVFEEVRKGVLGGISYGAIKKADDLRREQEAEKRAVHRREETVDVFRRRLREAAHGYTRNRDGLVAALENVICEAANVYRNSLVAADKDKAEQDLMKTNLGKLNTENMELRQQVDDAVRAMQKQAIDFNKQADIHAQTVDNILATRVATEKELEHAMRRITEYQRRLKVIRDHA